MGGERERERETERERQSQRERETEPERERQRSAIFFGVKTVSHQKLMFNTETRQDKAFSGRKRCRRERERQRELIVSCLVF